MSTYKLAGSDDSDDGPLDQPPPATTLAGRRRDARAAAADADRKTGAAKTPRKQTADHPPTERVAGIDAYRGLVMLLMMAEVLHLARVAEAFPDSAVWTWLGFHQTHAAWTGVSIHDLIQPSFSFLVGVAIPFSIASRLRRGQGKVRLTLHAVWRAVVLVLLGVMLRSVGRGQTYWTFEDTLSQIGLGYLPLFLIALAPGWLAWISIGIILTGYWGAFVMHPLPADHIYHDPQTRELIPLAGAAGLEAHFNNPSNLAQTFDRWFLNLFPRAEAWTGHPGGYATLSFIPTLATMLFGLIAGRWLQLRKSAATKLGRLVGLGLLALAAGWGLDWANICPIVKRVWTPAWTLYSAGWCLVALAAFYLVCDAIGFKIWAWPLRIIGANSIVAYVIAHLWEGFFASTIETHFGAGLYDAFGPGYAPLVRGGLVLAAYFGVLWWLYHRRIFIKV